MSNLGSGGHGGHVEDCACGGAAVPDMARPSLLTAVLVQGRLPTGVADIWPFEMPRFWQFGDVHPGHHEATLGQASQQLGLATPAWLLAGFGVSGSSVPVRVQPVPDGPECDAARRWIRCPGKLRPECTWRSAGVVAPRAYAGPAGSHRRDPVCLLAILLPDGRQTRRDAGPVGDFHGCPRTGTMEQWRGFA